MLKPVDDGPAVVACNTCRHSQDAREDDAGMRLKHRKDRPRSPIMRRLDAGRAPGMHSPHKRICKMGSD